MAKINKLSPHVANLIAAGEVVERPGSVVKELIENAIDAGASVITVEIRSGGMRLIKVSDNGSGMAPDDAETCFLRHATSKLKDERGLESIGTLGFRGEALAAISSVSRIRMITGEKGGETGTEICLEGGVVTLKRPAGCPEGTVISVSDLFFNTPARLKFMKSDRAEGAFVTSVVTRCALSHPEVSIKYIKDGAQECHTPGDGRLDSCAYSLLGRDFASGLLKAEGGDENVRVHGFVTAPVNARGSRNYQFFFVNGRFVKSKTLQAALEQAYKNCLFTGKFPACILYVELGYGKVDVNVHPTKTEVKFLNEKQAFDAVYYTVLSSLEGDRSKAEITISPGTKAALGAKSGDGLKASANPKADFFKTVSADAYRQSTPYRTVSERGGSAPLKDGTTAIYQEQFDLGSGFRSGSGGSGNSAADAAQKGKKASLLDEFSSLASSLSSDGEIASSEDNPALPSFVSGKPAGQAPTSAESNAFFSAPSTEAEVSDVPATVYDSFGTEFSGYTVIGEAMTTYIVVEKGDSLFLIDKHAAHERMLFDKLKKNTDEIMSQQLLIPYICPMSAEECAAIAENKEYLEAFGFEAEELDEGRIALRAMPSDIKEDNIPALLSELAEKLISGQTSDPSSMRDEILHSIACRAAIKAGTPSSASDLAAVAKAVMAGEVKYCPHGRPVAMELTKKTLDKNFKRIQ